MICQLAVGDRLYSSWSLRAWLIFDKFGIEHAPVRIHLDAPEFLAELAPFAPSRTVPAVRLPDGALVYDTLAIAETLAERYPDRALWPGDPAARARARSITAEMHAGFGPLRNECPMYLRRAYAGFAPSDAVRRDIARIEALWDYAGFGGEGWLFGDYSIADAFFAPVAARIASYDLPVGPAAAAYVAKTLADQAFRRWRAVGLAEMSVHVSCDLDLPDRPWPGPAPLPARAVTDLAPVNQGCPFSGDPVAQDSLAEIDGIVIGFCNPFCRDKVVADAAAWPDVLALLDRS
ncbi:MAG: glutathione S-transferase [Amaricoccus sp.]